MDTQGTLRIISDTRFILSLNDGVYASAELEAIEERTQKWIKEGGLLILPISCEIIDLRTITPQETIAYVDTEIAYDMEQIGQSLVAAIQNASR